MSGDTVVVWGNCQAEPLATLLTAPLAEEGLRVVPVPAVFLVDEPGLDRVRELVADSAYLISQPVRDEYRIPGCGTQQLADLQPATGRLVTYPVTFHIGAFPYQVNAHGGDGERVNAPLTDYHDLRAVVAAERSLAVDDALDWWPAPAAAAVRQIAAESIAELRRREEPLDSSVSELVDGPGAMMTLDHPANVVLAGLANGLLEVMGVHRPVDVPEREFLGARRTPVEPAVAAAHGWPDGAISRQWRIEGRDVPPAELLAAHLGLYRDRPDIVADTRTRYADRLAVLGL